MKASAKLLSSFVFVSLLLAGCAGGGYQSTAEVTRAGRDHVIVRAETWFDAQQAASSYCRRFRRSFLTIRRTPEVEGEDVAFFEFDCIDTISN